MGRGAKRANSSGPHQSDHGGSHPSRSILFYWSSNSDGVVAIQLAPGWGSRASTNTQPSTRQLIGLCAATLVATGIEMRDFEGGLACLHIPAAPTCNGQGDFVRAFGTIFQLSGWLNVIPLLFGVFIGAPLVAREVERGTHMLAWTQSVTRSGWIAVKLAGVVGLAAAVGGVFGLLMTWWRQPWDLIGSSFSLAGFDFEGLMFEPSRAKMLLRATSKSTPRSTSSFSYDFYSPARGSPGPAVLSSAYPYVSGVLPGGAFDRVGQPVCSRMIH